MKKITKKTLIDWEADNEEDVILDGPYDLDLKMFLDKVNKNTNLIKYLKSIGQIKTDITEIWDICLDPGATSSSASEQEIMDLQDFVYEVIVYMINHGHGKWYGTSA